MNMSGQRFIYSDLLFTFGMAAERAILRSINIAMLYHGALMLALKDLGHLYQPCRQLSTYLDSR